MNGTIELRKTEEPYESLATGIILQAVNDYIKLYKREQSGKITDLDRKNLKTLREWFESDWYKMLTEYDGGKLLHQVEKEVDSEKEKKIKTPRKRKEIDTKALCKTCKYVGYASGEITCDYIIIKHKRRGCKGGLNCERYECGEKHRFKFEYGKARKEASKIASGRIEEAMKKVMED